MIRCSIFRVIEIAPLCLEKADGLRSVPSHENVHMLQEAYGVFTLEGVTETIPTYTGLACQRHRMPGGCSHVRSRWWAV